MPKTKSKIKKLPLAKSDLILPEKIIKIKPKDKAHYVNSKEFEESIREFYRTGELTDKLGESINKIAHGLSYAPNFINYCVSVDTEALTQRGWLKHNEITEEDIILSYDIVDKQLKWSKIKNIFKSNYSGKMFHLKTKGIDSLVTPGHKFVTKSSKNSSTEKITEVDKLIKTDRIILNGAPVENPKDVIYTNDFVELMGWVVTEGNYLLGKNTHSVQLFQKEGKKCERIRQLLKRLNIAYKEYNWTNPEIKGFRFTGDFANQIICDAPDRIMSYDFILSLDQEQRLLIIQTMIDGDGSSRIRNNKEDRNPNYIYSRSFGQKEKASIDAFLMLCTLAGLTSSVLKIKNRSKFSSKDFYRVYLHNEPRVSINAETTDIFVNNIPKPTVDYNDIVWCPQTEYGTWVCRNGQYTFITGNSYKEDFVGDAVMKMYIALKNKKFRLDSGFSPFSYFTTIAFHAFINRIKKEKKHHDTIEDYKQRTYQDLMIEENIYTDPIHDDGKSEHFN